MPRHPKLPVVGSVASPAKPCGTCPYSRLTPVGVWSETEYRDLLASDRDQIGKVYGCHLADGTVCRGWLADQKRRGLPSIALRLALMSDARAARAAGGEKGKLGATYEAVDPDDPDLYDSIEEMAEANRGRDFPSRDPRARKLLKRKRRRRRR